MTLFDLPFPIFIIFQSYLSQKEYRNLINSSSKVHVKDIKKQTCYYSLKDYASVYFFKEPKYREFLLNKVHDSNKQLKAHLKVKGKKDFYPDLLKLFEAIAFEGLDNFLRIMNINNLSPFSKTKHLYICQSQNIRSLEGLESIVHLILSTFTSLTDLSHVSALQNLKSVRLEYCTGLSDINCLKYVEMIHILDCPLLNDEGIREIGTANSRNKVIKLESQDFITSVNHFINVEELSLYECIRVSNISNLPKLVRLFCADCAHIVRIQNLPNIQKIDADDRVNLQIKSESDVSEDSLQKNWLESIKYMKISIFSIQLSSILNLKQLTSFILTINTVDAEIETSNPGINLNCLKDLPSLRVLHIIYQDTYDCSRYKLDFDIHSFQQIKDIKIMRDIFFKGIFYPMPNLKFIHIDACSSFHTLKGLSIGRNYSSNSSILKLEIFNCPRFIPDEYFYSILYYVVKKMTYCDEKACQYYYEEDEEEGQENNMDERGDKEQKLMDLPDKKEHFLNTNSLLTTLPTLPSLEEAAEGSQRILPDKTICFKYSIPSLYYIDIIQGQLFFQRIYCLHLHYLSNFMNLHEFSDALAQIPYFFLSSCMKLQSLYHPGTIINHQRLGLSSCMSFEDLNCFDNEESVVKRFSLLSCDNVKDIRPLLKCQCDRIEVHFLDRSEKILGWKELTEQKKIFPFPMDEFFTFYEYYWHP